MHDTIVRLADVWKTCNKIRAAAFRVGLNLWDWYRPLDPDGNSLISESKFVSVLAGPLRAAVGLSEAEVAQLADYFRAQDGRVLYHQLCQIIHGEEAGGRDAAAADCVLEACPPPPEPACHRLDQWQARRLCCLLATIADRQLPLKPYFQDYELVAKNDGRITFAHFARILSYVGVQVSAEDFNLLVRRFIKDSYTLDYVEFLRALDAVKKEGIQGLGVEYRNPAATLDTTLPKLSRPEVSAGRAAPAAAAADVFHPALQPPRPTRHLLDLMLRMQQLVLQRGVRVAEFFRDYDPLNCGRIAATQFRRALAASGLGAALSPDEVLCVLRHYADPNDADRVCWRTFEDDCDQGVGEAPGRGAGRGGRGGGGAAGARLGRGARRGRRGRRGGRAQRARAGPGAGGAAARARRLRRALHRPAPGLLRPRPTQQRARVALGGAARAGAAGRAAGRGAGARARGALPRRLRVQLRAPARRAGGASGGERARGGRGRGGRVGGGPRRARAPRRPARDRHRAHTRQDQGQDGARRRAAARVPAAVRPAPRAGRAARGLLPRPRRRRPRAHAARDGHAHGSVLRAGAAALRGVRAVLRDGGRGADAGRAGARAAAAARAARARARLAAQLPQLRGAQRGGGRARQARQVPRPALQHTGGVQGHGQAAVRHDPARVGGARALPARPAAAGVGARAGPALQVLRLPARLRRRGELPRAGERLGPDIRVVERAALLMFVKCGVFNTCSFHNKLITYRIPARVPFYITSSSDLK